MRIFSKRTLIEISQKIRPWHITDALVLSTLILAVWRLNTLVNIKDVPLYDEGTYLGNGIRFTDLSWETIRSPLYCFWYFLIHLLEPDSVDLYFRNLQILNVAVAIVIYLYLRRLGAGIVLSALLPVFCMASKIPDVTPMPGHFAGLLLLTGLLSSTLMPSLSQSFFLLTAVSFAAAYARSEYIAIFLIIIFFLIVYLCRSVLYSKIPIISQVLLPSGLLLAFIGLLVILFGSPTTGSDTLMAFGQHFALNWISWHPTALNPWLDWHKVVWQVFGQINTVQEAVWRNPIYFFRHILDNIITYPKQVLTLSLLWLPSLNRTLARSVRFSELLFLLMAASYIVRQRRALIDWIQKKDPTILRISFVAVTVSTCLSAFLIYPRHHYLITQVILAGIILTISLARTLPLNTKVAWQLTARAALLISLLVLIITPIQNNPLLLQGGVQPNIQVIRFIQTLKIQERVNLFELDGGYSHYIGKNYHWVIENPFIISNRYKPCLESEGDRECHLGENFRDFAQRNQINMLVLDEMAMAQTRFKDDPEFQTLVEHPEDRGFSALSIPQTAKVVFVAQRLLS